MLRSLLIVIALLTSPTLLRAQEPTIELLGVGANASWLPQWVVCGHP